MFTRDSLTWLIGMIGGVAVAIAANFHLFPWIPENAQHVISLIAFIVSVISGKMSTSPRPISPEGYRQEVVDHQVAMVKAVAEGKEVVAQPPIPPVVVIEETKTPVA